MTGRESAVLALLAVAAGLVVAGAAMLSPAVGLIVAGVAVAALTLITFTEV